MKYIIATVVVIIILMIAMQVRARNASIIGATGPAKPNKQDLVGTTNNPAQVVLSNALQTLANVPTVVLTQSGSSALNSGSFQGNYVQHNVVLNAN